MLSNRMPEAKLEWKVIISVIIVALSMFPNKLPDARS